VSGMRLTVAFGVSSLAVWALGPLVKAGGFRTLLLAMAAIALATSIAVALLPRAAPRKDRAIRVVELQQLPPAAD
jgi:uncharacterized membrane protein